MLASIEAPVKDPISRLLNAKVAVAISRRSYGLYLFHVVAAAYFPNVQGGWLLSAAVTFGLAWASYTVLEQPIMRWSARRVDSRSYATLSTPGQRT